LTKEWRTALPVKHVCRNIVRKPKHIKREEQTPKNGQSRSRSKKTPPPPEPESRCNQEKKTQYSFKKETTCEKSGPAKRGRRGVRTTVQNDGISQGQKRTCGKKKKKGTAKRGLGPLGR